MGRNASFDVRYGVAVVNDIWINARMWMRVLTGGAMASTMVDERLAGWFIVTIRSSIGMGEYRWQKNVYLTLAHVHYYLWVSGTPPQRLMGEFG